MGTLTIRTAGPLLTYIPPSSCQFDNLPDGILAGENLDAGDACYIKSDGKVWRSNGTSANAAARVRGYVLVPYSVGDPVILFHDIVLNYSSGLTPGANYYASSSHPGGLDDAPTTGGIRPVAYAVSTTNIMALRSTY